MTDFLTCRKCGVYVAATMPTGDGTIGTINVNVLDDQDSLPGTAAPMVYEGESVEDRGGEARLRAWTPVTMTIGSFEHLAGKADARQRARSRSSAARVLCPGDAEGHAALFAAVSTCPVGVRDAIAPRTVWSGPDRGCESLRRRRNGLRAGLRLRSVPSIAQMQKKRGTMGEATARDRRIQPCFGDTDGPRYPSTEGVTRFDAYIAAVLTRRTSSSQASHQRRGLTGVLSLCRVHREGLTTCTGHSRLRPFPLPPPGGGPGGERSCSRARSRRSRSRSQRQAGKLPLDQVVTPVAQLATTRVSPSTGSTHTRSQKIRVYFSRPTSGKTTFFRERPAARRRGAACWRSRRWVPTLAGIAAGGADYFYRGGLGYRVLYLTVSGRVGTATLADELAGYEAMVELAAPPRPIRRSHHTHVIGDIRPEVPRFCWRSRDAGARGRVRNGAFPTPRRHLWSFCCEYTMPSPARAHG